MSGLSSAGQPPVQAALVISPTLARGCIAQGGGASTMLDSTWARVTQVTNMAQDRKAKHLFIGEWECVMHLLVEC